MHYSIKKLGLLITASLLVSACSNDGPSDTITPPPPLPTSKYQVTVTNATHGQPFSPVAVISHNSNYQAFTIGQPATLGLETLAEGGDNSALLSEAVASGNSNAQASGSGVILPGAKETIELTIIRNNANSLSIVTMLVNTNDAITGHTNIDISQLSVGDSIRLNGVAYDAGTELNTELAGTIPGPADGGQGFSSLRDDIADQVTMHPGVVTSDDGLSNSVLTEMHRFDNHTLTIEITRTE